MSSSLIYIRINSNIALGKVKAIGVSNASELKLNDILPHATVIPAVNQLELHLYNHQPELVKFCQEKGIVVQAYSPLGSTSSPLLKDETATAIANKHGLQVADVLIGYLREFSVAYAFTRSEIDCFIS